MNFFSMLFDYIRIRKKFWLIPIILSLLFLGAFVIVAETPLAPFIYTMF